MAEESILITGGAGFIGSHLAERLIGDGRRVAVLDNFDTFYDPDIKRRNVAPRPLFLDDSVTLTLFCY